MVRSRRRRGGISGAHCDRGRDPEISLAPTSSEKEAPAEAMEVGAAVAAEEPDEVESEEVDKAVDPEEARATRAEPVDEAVENPDEELEKEEEDDEAEVDPDEGLEEEEEDEENAREEAEEASDEETVMEPLNVLMPWEVQEEKNESEEAEDEKDDEEPSEVDKKSAEVDGEEPEETKNGTEAGSVAEGGTKGLVHESAVDDVNDKTEGEHGKHGDKNKDEVADIWSDCDDAGGSKGDMQNSELAGGLELLVDELPKNCVVGDIAVVFSECAADIKSVRIIRNSSTKKSKDIAFVCFASIEAADKALTEFKKGIEVKGIKVRVSACRHNDSLFLGNICKSSTKDEVLTALNNIGIPEFKLNLPSNKTGKNRGYGFLKFGSHYHARAAFRRLMKSDVDFGVGRSLTVSFYQKPTKPSDDLMEAKRVYLEHVPHYWNEDKIKECCEGYGKILNVDLFQISKEEKIETFSFVEFSSSNSALACVKGINNAKIVDGSFKLSACLARPKNGATSEGATSKKENDHTGKVCVDNKSIQQLPKGNKGKVTSRVKEVVVKKDAPSKLLKDNDREITAQDATEVQQTSKPSEGERRHGKYKSVSVNQIPSKKARNNLLQTSNPAKGKRKSGKDANININERPLKKAHNNRNGRRPNRSRGTGQIAGPQYSRARNRLGESSRSKAYTSDLEPHAGYIPPADQVHRTQAYDQQRIRRYDIHPIDVHPYDRETAPSQSIYSGHTSHAHYQTGYEYMYPTLPTSESYYPGRGPFISRRGDY